MYLLVDDMIPQKLVMNFFEVVEVVGLDKKARISQFNFAFDLCVFCVLSFEITIFKITCYVGSTIFDILPLLLCT